MIVNNRQICQERYISVDIETAGPSPRHYSMLSIGAVTVFAGKIRSHSGKYDAIAQRQRAYMARL